ncbi:uncharacterized protein EKO05_0000131 [Ascochyta rabiei]|uniref:Uncharacterized protein n=1 Tax=Didymella rabiei TaxID=5454 RepID=A0A163K4G7_DIDRA|nr:uncharacterized protein EKO05_0000131 [Ascochyta rabiei]KZM26765.1 hypothetical protein ST47_g2076 [Ascochyta rabiei]UPX09442.1 hypothetical protein EKO05_0000131 [Ascochyta rabiei]
MSTSRAANPLQQMHDDDDRLAPPSSAQSNIASKRAAKLHPLALSTAAAPVRRTFFAPWNSSSTGHQRAENRLSGSTSWRASRSLKLGEQYKGGLAGGKRIADAVGAGSEDFGKDGRKANGCWEKGAQGLRTDGQQSLADIWSSSKAGKKSVSEKKILLAESRLDLDQDTLDATLEPQETPIFEGLCFYVNGSTAPLVSDHRLKHLLAAHGARHSIALGRRTVTHVILGTANANGGAGGGLAATKIQKEIARTGGKAVKYVTVNWVLESIKTGRRLPESRFAPLKLAHQNQGSVLGMMNRSNATRITHG